MAESDRVGGSDADSMPHGESRASDLAVLGLGLLLLVAFLPAFAFTAWSPRFALLLASIPPGLVALAQLIRGRDRAAMMGAGLGVVAIASGFASTTPRIALLGEVSKEASALLIVAYIGVWALGRTLGSYGRSMLVPTLLVGLAANAVVGLLQAIFRSTSREYGLNMGRASGLTAHPIYLGALMAGGAGLYAWLCVRGGTRWAAYLFGVGVFSLVANLSGSRVALAAIIAAALLLAARHRSRRSLIVLAAVGAGIALGAPLAAHAADRSEATRAIDASQAGTARLGADSAHRLEVWRDGVGAAGSRPLLGWGPGSFQEAVQGRLSPEAVLTGGGQSERGQIWFDAHNIFVEYLVTMGVAGLGVMLVFGYHAARRARGPLLYFAGAIALSWIVEPASMLTTPMVMLALGAATEPLAGPSPAQQPDRTRSPVVAALALLLGVGYCAIDLRLDHAIRSADPGQMRAASNWYPSDPVVHDLLAQSVVFHLVVGTATPAEALAARKQVTEMDPSRVVWWVQYAALQLYLGQLPEARVSLEHAVKLEPWSSAAWPLLLTVAQRSGDHELEAEARTHLCRLDLEGCDEHR